VVVNSSVKIKRHWENFLEATDALDMTISAVFE